MRVMILGAGGRLGRDLVATAPAGITLKGFTHAELDIARPKALMVAIELFGPDLVINAAAYTQVDRAETEKDLAFRINATAVGELGRLAAQRDVRVVHVSTDYVFDGETTKSYTEESEPHPVNAYGASKLAGEIALKESGAEYLIVRSQWLFGIHGKSFPRTMWERAKSGAATKVVNDQSGRPTYTPDLAQSLWTLAKSRATGVRHVTNEGEATWFDVATHVFQRAKRSELLTACRSEEYPTPARRPHYGVLSTDRFERDGGRMRSWRDAINEFLMLLER